MHKFHISKDGTARQCRAQTPASCTATPADQKEHYDTKQEAQKAYEKKQSSTTIKPLKKPRISPDQRAIERLDTSIYDLKTALDFMKFDRREGIEYLENNNIFVSDEEEIEDLIEASENLRTQLINSAQTIEKPKPKAKLPVKDKVSTPRKSKIAKESGPLTVTGKPFDYHSFNFEVAGGYGYYGSSDSSPAFKELGKIEKIAVDKNAIVFYNKDDKAVAYTTEGDCCSASTVENINVEPIDSEISSIEKTDEIIDPVKAGYAKEPDEYDNVTEVNRYVVQYENGVKQYFDDVNVSNGYYSSMVSMISNFEV